MDSTVFIEDEVGRKLDRCISDGLLKLGGGILIGGVFSLLFFKRNKWPLVLGGGFGIGMAYKNCERDLNASMNRKLDVTADKKC